jgi:hypothetical protein
MCTASGSWIYYELERICKEVVMVYSKNSPDLYLKRLRKITENLGQDIWCLGRDSNQAPPEYKSAPTCLV